MSIEFKKIDGKLILIYIPAMGIDDIKRHLSRDIWSHNTATCERGNETSARRFCNKNFALP